MNLKQAAGIEAAKFVKDGMIVGLGTGSTAYYMVEEIGRRMREEGLNITGVTTSNATKEQAEKLGIPLKSIDEVPVVDLTIDGADEISKAFQGIKGGGAALLFEKIVATYSKQVIWIVDESKLRYGKIIITADADVDGSHIRILFLTFIWKFAPELIEKGYIYAAVPPLYKATWGTNIKYLKDDAALETFRKTMNRSFELGRMKGYEEVWPLPTFPLIGGVANW